MPNDSAALAPIPAPDIPSEDDYQALCAALSESARGRWFLSEYARRNRQADTEILLDAMGRIEAHIRADASAAERLRDQLRLLLIAIRLARPEIDTAQAPAKAAKLDVLLQTLEQRIDAMAEGRADALSSGVLPATPSEPEEQDNDIPRARLAVVPPPDEPELPIPSPVVAAPPAIALVGMAAMMPSPFDMEDGLRTDEETEAAMPAIELPPPAPAGAGVMPIAPQPANDALPQINQELVEQARAAIAQARSEIEVGHSALTAGKPKRDPLAAIMMLSEDERIALFT